MPRPSRERRVRLRGWQLEALRIYRDELRRDFLLTATPGAGKTTFALAVAAGLLERRAVDRIIVVAPTDHLRTQWALAAERAGLCLDPTLTNAVGPVSGDVQGYVTTYAQVAAKPSLHAARSTSRRCLVVLDEIHHAGDGLSWGDAVAEAFERSDRRLCLTGTPFRTRASERIPFIRYESEAGDVLVSRADFTYTYAQALRDHVVRPVVFAAYTGVSRWRNDAGAVIAASLSEAGTKSTEMSAWRTALDPRGAWVPHVIAAMQERVDLLRVSGMPDAAGLVLASDQDDARAYAEIVERVTGERPYLILSDDPSASTKILDFNDSDARFAVCVRMVSEGVDVPRAACLAWLTSYRTPLFFAQAVGRVVRSRRPGESATVFLPAVRPLLALAAELEVERNHVLAAPAATTELDVFDNVLVAEAGIDRTQPGSTWEALEAEAEFAHVLHAGRAVTADAGRGAQAEQGEHDEFLDFLGLPGLLSPAQTAALLSRRDADLKRRASRSRRSAGALSPSVTERAAQEGVDPGSGATERHTWRDSADLRRELNQLVAVVAARTGASHARLHLDLRAAVPGPPSAAASAELLRARRDHLRTML